MAPYRRQRGRDYGGSVAEIFETVLFRKPGLPGGKLAPRWEKALWMGKAASTDEHLLGTAAGRETARTVTRRPEGKRWSKHLFAQVICTPWEPKASLSPQPQQPRRHRGPPGNHPRLRIMRRTRGAAQPHMQSEDRETLVRGG